MVNAYSANGGECKPREVGDCGGPLAANLTKLFCRDTKKQGGTAN